METQGLQGPRIALLIDFDNVILGVEEPPGFDIELVVNALRSRGTVVLGRAYGDWYRHHRHRRKLMDHGIELVETPAFGPIIKNSADIRIALDAFEIGMTQHHIHEFCLVSGDSDFLPLIKRLQYLGKTVTVIAGIKFTSELVRRNCNEFISYENLLAESVGATEDATVLEGAFALLVRTINTLHERNMEVRSSTVKQMMMQLNPVFSERSFGCNQFKQFLDKGCRAGMIKLGRRDLNSGEYNVLLPTDVEDEVVGNIETVTPEPEKSARPSRRGRGRRGVPVGDTLVAEAEVAPIIADESTPAVADDGEATAREISAREALRQGRLRSSGRTWKGGAANRSVLQGAVGTLSTPAEEQSPSLESASEARTPPSHQSSEETIEELVVTDGGAVAENELGTPEAAVVEAETPEAAEEKPKRAPRRRRKPAAKKAETAEGESEAVETPAPEPEVVTPPVEPEPELPLEPVKGEEKKAAKKPARRRAPRKKKEE